MTELLYYQDAYLQEFDAVVTACDTDGGALRVARWTARLSIRAAAGSPTT